MSALKAKRTRRKTKKAGPDSVPRPELRAVSRAQLGRDPERRVYRLQRDDASIEDPLGDWPEDD